jgi:two-component system response regulator YesN
MFIDNKAGRSMTINELAAFFGYSRNSLSNVFHRETGIKLKTFIDQQRVETAKKMLQYSNLKIVEIAKIMEFSDLFSFSRFFFRNSGEYPSKFRRQK